ncbi:Chloramphenicol O-acetyltransferase [Duganella sacchari]|uniref:Chloramphenicol O-acetyltransferase n=1 Tax=Duganella sacchari TaxID=551987 RepID=A0A1M7P560_9BURK|nr:CatA-like O-acetyltransferase [Duganella sacchari]SHN11256.1 Chloramphenicol O-acetyltransferase [Duganella sacchari]
MQNFEKRRDRYDAFASFENPLVNLSFELEVPEFRPYCKQHGLPPFHFFLYHVLHALQGIDNFMYRIHKGEVIKIDDFWASYTVLNQDQNLNFARFEMTEDLKEFIARSVAAKEFAEASEKIVNTTAKLSEYDQRRNIHITCMPWLKLSSIEHPIYEHKSYDIPSLAWGRFSDARDDGKLTMNMSVQAHHGFVDGYHIHLLAQAIAAGIAKTIAS